MIMNVFFPCLCSMHAFNVQFFLGFDDSCGMATTDKCIVIFPPIGSDINSNTSYLMEVSNNGSNIRWNLNIILKFGYFVSLSILQQLQFSSYSKSRESTRLQIASGFAPNTTLDNVFGGCTTRPRRIAKSLISPKKSSMMTALSQVSPSTLRSLIVYLLQSLLTTPIVM